MVVGARTCEADQLIRSSSVVGGALFEPVEHVGLGDPRGEVEPAGQANRLGHDVEELGFGGKTQEGEHLLDFFWGVGHVVSH